MNLRPVLRRLINVARLLRAGRNVQQIARELEYAPRTIYRDVHFLRDDLGLELDFDPRTKSWALRARKAPGETLMFDER